MEGQYIFKPARADQFLQFFDQKHFEQVHHQKSDLFNIEQWTYLPGQNMIMRKNWQNYILRVRYCPEELENVIEVTLELDEIKMSDYTFSGKKPKNYDVGKDIVINFQFHDFDSNSTFWTD